MIFILTVDLIIGLMYDNMTFDMWLIISIFIIYSWYWSLFISLFLFYIMFFDCSLLFYLYRRYFIDFVSIILCYFMILLCWWWIVDRVGLIMVGNWYVLFIPWCWWWCLSLLLFLIIKHRRCVNTLIMKSLSLLL